MSHTTLYGVKPNGDVKSAKDFPNAWGSAPYVWNVLALRYLTEPWFIAMQHDPDSLWRLDRNKAVSWAERIALILTFDYVIVPRDSMATCAEAIRDFMGMHPNQPNVACHWPQFATELRGAYTTPGVKGICWNHTSVSTPVWQIYNEETEESRPYNVNTDEGHFFIFEKYPELK